MTTSSIRLAAAIAAVPLMALAAQAAPATDKQSDTAAKLQALQQQVEALQAQIADLKRSTTDQYADVQRQYAEVHNQADKVEKAQKDTAKDTAKATIANGRPTISSADGKFTASLRAQLQVDAGYYMQSRAATALPAAYGPDLSSGVNLRRVQLGLQGKVFGDWSYNFFYDFGNTSTESPGHIINAYMQYDGLAPLAIRVGAYAPPHNFDDSTGAGDLMFLERTSPANLARGIAGSEGRAAVSLIYADDRIFGALSYSGGKIQDTAVFDEQNAALGRVVGMVYEDKDADARLLLSGNFAHVFKFADALANGSASLETTAGKTAMHTVTLADFPEITVDSTAAKLVSTGALGANHVTSWGLEAAGNWQNVYLQGGYFDYEVDRAAATYSVYTSATTYASKTITPDNDSFNGWYAQASWILTGESKSYVKATGAYTIPKPLHPFSLSDGGWGAWEIAARYSDLNLNDHENDATSLVTGWSGNTKTYTFTNAVRGGEQKVYTFGINWYPNSNVRFLLDYMRVDIDRLQTVTTATTPTMASLNGGQKFQAVAIRSQIAF